MIYTRSYLKERINAGIKGKIGMLVSSDNLCNQGVRAVLAETDLRSTKRYAYLSPNLFDGIYQYPAPADLKGIGIIDIRPQVNRSVQSEVSLTTVEEFDRTKADFRCAVDDEDAIRQLLISVPINDEEIVVSTLDSLTAGGGTWSAVGDATNLVASSDWFVKGSAAIKYDIGAGATTTAGIQNTSLNSFDITEYLMKTVFHWQYLSNADNITDFKIRIGSSPLNYYEVTATTTHSNTAFAVGTNLLRFDMSSKTTTGTPVDTACTYVAIFMTKTAGKISQTGFYADHIWLKKGEVYQVGYYSDYPWQSSTGTYLIDSTSDEDFLVMTSDEIDMVIHKCVEYAASEVDEVNLETRASSKYVSLRDTYVSNNPSESKSILTTYYNF